MSKYNYMKIVCHIYALDIVTVAQPTSHNLDLTRYIRGLGYSRSPMVLSDCIRTAGEKTGSGLNNAVPGIFGETKLKCVSLGCVYPSRCAYWTFQAFRIGNVLVDVEQANRDESQPFLVPVKRTLDKYLQ